jgi:hypothetical protein
MKALRNPVALITLLALQACSMMPWTDDSVHDKIDIASLDNPSSIQPQIFNLRGHVVNGHEVSTFTPCGSNKQYWLNLAKISSSENKRLKQSISFPYQPVEAKVSGYLQLSNPKKNGVAANYDAIFKAESLSLITSDSTSCDPGVTAKDSDWLGSYQAKSKTNSNFQVSLELFADHSAVTTYQYNDGQPNSIERGFWQRLNHSQIQVIMTNHQNQPLVSERLFSRTGTTLTATQEKVGSMVYEMAQGGLVLFKEDQALNERQSDTISNDPHQIHSSAAFDPKVDRALRQYLSEQHIDAAGTRYRWLTYDLNHDGSNELLVQLDWCGSGGCTLLIFENEQKIWQFNSKVILVNTPINLGSERHQKWQDLVLFVSGGGAAPNQHTLKFNGSKYPLNPSLAPIADYDKISPIQLFADGLTPHQEGITL